MAKIKFDVVTNAKKVAKELDDVANSVKKIGKNAKDGGSNVSGMGAMISKSFSPLVVGGMIGLGIKAIGDDIATMNDNAVRTVRTLKEINFLRGEAGKKIVRELSIDTGEDIEKIKDVAGPIFSANSSRSDAVLKRLIKNAIIEEKSSGGDATTVAMGTSGLLNASDTFTKPGGAGDIGAQNLLVGTVKSANMNVGEIGILGPLFPAAAAAGVSPSEAAAAFSMVTSSGVPAAQAVTQVIALLFAWRKNGNGMSLIEFIQYALALEDSKKQFELLTETGFKAASVLSSNTSGFKSLSGTLKAAGQKTTSSSLERFNKQVESGELVGEQLSNRISTIDKSKGSDDITSEKLAVGQAIGSVAYESFMAFMKTGLRFNPASGLANLATGDILGDSADVNIDAAGQKIDAILNRKTAQSLSEVALQTNKLATKNQMNNKEGNGL